MIAVPASTVISPFMINAVPAHAAFSTATTRTIKGTAVTMQWGTVQVTIVVKNKRITDLSATYPSERPRSAYINKQAIPWLRSEALKAQSADIDLISGATMTSEAFARSLQAAIKTAKI